MPHQRPQGPHDAKPCGPQTTGSHENLPFFCALSSTPARGIVSKLEIPRFAGGTACFLVLAVTFYVAGRTASGQKRQTGAFPRSLTHLPSINTYVITGQG